MLVGFYLFGCDRNPSKYSRKLSKSERNRHLGSHYIVLINNSLAPLVKALIFLPLFQSYFISPATNAHNQTSIFSRIHPGERNVQALS